jgi:hypothetical protein
MEALLTAHLTELKKQFDLSRRCMARALRDRNRFLRADENRFRDLQKLLSARS